MAGGPRPPSSARPRRCIRESIFDLGVSRPIEHGQISPRRVAKRQRQTRQRCGNGGSNRPELPSCAGLLRQNARGSRGSRGRTPRPMTDESELLRQRRIRSFVLRAGRMGTGQVRALAELAPRHVIAYAPQPIDAAALFGRRAPLVLEIGFGMGDATAAIAQALPGTDFIGVEVHPPGVGSLLQRIDERGLTNLRIVQHDAVEVLEHMIAPASLAGVNVFFPDPWHKKRHHKRRLIQPPFVAMLASRLAPGGTLHCATDWQPYAEQILAVLQAEPTLRNTAESYARRPAHRPLTKFEADRKSVV
jgi:tRNA (guanine-N7-)-methyltransferase